MSVCTFLASDHPLSPTLPPSCSAGFALCPFDDAASYTDKPYALCLEGDCTDADAEQLIFYLQAALQKTSCVEIWHVWLTDYYEFEDRPFLHKRTVSAGSLTAAHIQALANADIWNTPDKQYPERPSFYCLRITP